MTPRSPSSLTRMLALAGLLALVPVYWTPMWWVSLTAPNYPQDRFPDGIKIHFGFTGVSNGCTAPPKTSRLAQETSAEELPWRSEEGTAGKDKSKADTGDSMDCVHEMNTINHYVGMRPIEVGAPVELLLARYILGLFAVMLLGFAAGPGRKRTILLAGGFSAVCGWMLVDLLVLGRLADTVKLYQTNAGKYFPETEKLVAWGAQLTTVSTGVAIALCVVMALVVVGVKRWPGLELALGVAPALLPLYFILSFAGWLWFYGHNMHPWGAFTLKPFMPTVFGDGKVAQFTTHSYPHWGFSLLVLSMVLLLAAVARRRLELTEPQAPAVGSTGALKPAVSGHAS